MITKRLRELKQNLANAIYLHEKMKNSYFWNPPGIASQRRSYENQHSFKFEYPGLKVDCDTECSCKNIYYKGFFEFEGKKTTLTKIKNLYNAISEIV